LNKKDGFQVLVKLTGAKLEEALRSVTADRSFYKSRVMEQLYGY
jgi:hypothetical protein